MALVGAVGCSVSAARPPLLEDPTPLARCVVQKSAQSPLVTEWPASEKAHLESLLATGTVAVAYDGCELRLLETCHPEGEYAFHRTSLASDTLEITTLDELYGKLPLGAASLQGALTSSGRLAIDTTAVGQLRLAGEPELPDTEACREATHVVRALSVGAFDLRSGGEGERSGDGSLGPASAGGRSRRTSTRLRAAGDPKACPETGDAQNAACRAPLQLFLTPAVIAAPKVARVVAQAPSVQPEPPPEPVAPIPPPAPEPEPTPEPDVPPPPAEPVTACDALTAKVVSVRPEPAFMLLLPNGGSRLSILFVNDGDRDVALPDSGHLVVLDAQGNGHTPEMIPTTGTWDMGVPLPAHTRRTLDVIIRHKLPLADAIGVQLRNVSLSDDAFKTCTLKSGRDG